jgi:hypothetical protein
VWKGRLLSVGEDRGWRWGWKWWRGVVERRRLMVKREGLGDLGLVVKKIERRGVSGDAMVAGVCRRDGVREMMGKMEMKELMV